MYQIIYDLLASYHGDPSETWFLVWSNIMIYGLLSFFIGLVGYLIYILTAKIYKMIASVGKGINAKNDDDSWRPNWKRRKKKGKSNAESINIGPIE